MLKKCILIPAAFLLFMSFMGSNSMAMGDKAHIRKTFPEWLTTKIKDMEKAPRANPPVEIWKCSYKEKSAYYLPPRCCDIYSDLYDTEGKLICHPGGGITGRGDGKCMDFQFNKDTWELIWKDNR